MTRQMEKRALAHPRGARHRRSGWRRFAGLMAWCISVLIAVDGCGTAVMTSSPAPSSTPIPSATVTPTPQATPTPPHGVFIATGSPGAPHSDGAGILLANGDVLVLGSAQNIAELYDPKSGTFNATGVLSEDASAPLAFLLPSGKVLVVEATGIDRYAALYDPATGQFSTTGQVPAASGSESGDFLSGESGSVLHDGRVLIAGGADYADQGVTRSAYLYDPASGKFTRTGSMKTPRSCFTATTLLDGRVLVVGGDDGECGSHSVIYTSAELYDPATGKFIATGSMATPRREATATLLENGKVLIVGGDNDDDGVLSSAELYDPDTGKFTHTGSMQTARINHTATLLADGRVLIAGSGNDSLASAEIYDPATGKFSPTGSMIHGRTNHISTLLADGRVLIVGGIDQQSAELYWP